MGKIKIYTSSNPYILLLYRIAIVYILFTVCRLAFYIYNISHFTGISTKHFFELFIGGLLFDTSAIMYLNILVILLMALPLKLRHNKYYQAIIMWVFFICNGIGITVNCMDIPYYNFVLERTTFDVFDQFKNDNNMALLFAKFFVDFWPITILGLSLLFIMVFSYKRVELSTTKNSSWYIYYPIGIAMFLIIGYITVVGMRGGVRHSTRPITMSNAGQFVQNPNETAIVLNTPFCLIQSVNAPAYERLNYYRNNVELEKIYSPYHHASDQKGNKCNVVIIVVESFNKEFIGGLNKDLDSGHYKGYTPFVDSLIGHSRTFKHSFANGRKSIDMMPSIFTSIPYLETPFVLTKYYSNKFTSLPALMKDMGYKTAFFHGAPNGSMGFLAFSKLIGFDEYYGKDEYNNNADFDGYWGIWDEEFFQYFAHTLDTFSQPFMAGIFTASSHHPFILPEKHSNRFSNGDFPLHRCIQYTDYSLRKFFETASKLPWYNNTLFVITADHVSLNQRPEFKNDLGYFSIPIIFFKPNSDIVGVDTITLAQQTDIMPSVINYIGYSKPYIAFGKDILKPDSLNIVFNQLGKSCRFYKDEYMIVCEKSKPVALYNFKNDRLLSNNLIINQPETLKKLEFQMQAFLQQYQNRMIDNDLYVK